MGRPPTSGICLTCRTRRVKCDGGRPHCQPCLRSGHVCRGYEPKSKLRMRNLGVYTQNGGKQQLVTLQTPRGSRADSPPVELDLGGFRETIAFTYFLERYTWAHFWMPLIQAQEKKSKTLEYKSSLALVYGYFGIANKDKNTEVQGLEMYGKMIQQVKSVLDRGSKDELANMIVSVMILGMFTYAVDKELSLQHHLGISQILQYCGPSYFSGKPLVHEFRACRRVLICQAFAQRRRTFLESEEWKSLPFEPRPKQSSDFLLDILVDIPGILEDLGHLQNGDSQSTRDQLAHKVGFLMDCLVYWRLQWKQLKPRGTSQVNRQMRPYIAFDTPEDRIGWLLDNPLEFETPEQATEILTYNAALLCLMQLGDMLQTEGSKKDLLSGSVLDHVLDVSWNRSQSNLLTPTEIKFFCQPAIEALRTLPYLRRYWITNGNTDVAIQAPVGIVYCAVRRQPRLMELVKWETLLPIFNSSVASELGAYQVVPDNAMDN